MPDFRKQQLCWVDRVSVAQNVHRVWSVRLWVPLLSLWTEQEAVGGSQGPLDQLGPLPRARCPSWGRTQRS